MSGGVDSSVAAALLVQQGFEVIGMMLRLWSEAGREATNRCCTPDALALARRVAARLDIPFYAIDAQEIFYEKVVNHFIEGYGNGITPNPCLACNRHIRWDFLLRRALSLEAQHLATGHYAQIAQDTDGTFQLIKAIDKEKDQSYVLHVLTQEQLASTLFPIGAYTKSDVRKMAKEFDLPVSERSDSQDLCFLGNGNYQDFLRRNSPQAISPGPILSIDGKQLGQHEGLAFYTIGQRKGLGVSSSEPLYVISKERSSNTLIVGKNEHLGKNELIVNGVNWIAGASPKGKIRVGVKIRYKSHEVRGSVTPLGDQSLHVILDDQLRAITPGQAAVFYDQDRCLGGGIIQG